MLRFHTAREWRRDSALGGPWFSNLTIQSTDSVFQLTS